MLNVPQTAPPAGGFNFMDPITKLAEPRVVTGQEFAVPFTYGD